MLLLPTRAAPSAFPRALALLVVLVGAVGSAACGAMSPSAAQPVQLTMWSHGGTPAEWEVLADQVERWNDSQTESVVELVELPEGDYGVHAQAAITAGELPDIVEVDGPLVASYAYQGALAPLEDHLDPTVMDTLLPSLMEQGTYDGSLYAVGGFESSLALYADRSALIEAGVRIPASTDDAWTAVEFTGVLTALASHDDDGLVLDLKLNYGVGEWLTYGFSPLLWSSGADLLDRETGTASGTLNSPAAVFALATLGSWREFVDPNTDDDAFVNRGVPLSWVGHWAYNDYAAALGEDLVLLPLPDLGHGSRNSQGSWAWALSSTGDHPDQAADVLEFLVSDASVRETTAANGAVPGTWATLQRDPRFGASGALESFAQALTRTCHGSSSEGGTLVAEQDGHRRAAVGGGCISSSRPSTPGYPTLSNAFASAVDQVLNGEDPTTALDAAAAAIDDDVRANAGYLPPSMPGATAEDQPRSSDRASCPSGRRGSAAGCP